MHEPVTHAEIKRLERERPKLNAELHYTIGGSVETIVHSNLNAEREAAITKGSRRLHQSSEHLRANFDAAKPDSRTGVYSRAADGGAGFSQATPVESQSFPLTKQHEGNKAQW